MSTTPRVFESGIVVSPAGAAVPAGAIGETVTATTANSAAMSTGTNINAASITLNKGRWQVFGKAYIEMVSLVTSISNRAASISTTSTTANAKSYVNTTDTALNDIGLHPCPIVVDVTADATPVYLVAAATFVVGAGQVRINGSFTQLYAIRVG